MVNVPRALFKTRTGRQARYHIGIDESPEWAYWGEKLAPLKGFPGVLWDRSRRKTSAKSGIQEFMSQTGQNRGRP
jgi:hypothetical protein